MVRAIQTVYKLFRLCPYILQETESIEELKNVEDEIHSSEVDVEVDIVVTRILKL
jgi:hypothetical protein